MACKVEFQRRHFEWLAEVFRGLQPEKTSADAPSDWNKFESDRCEIAEAFAFALATTNPNFDRAKFLAACGVPSAS